VPIITANASGAITGNHGPPALDIGPLPTRFARRITASGSPAGMFGAWGAGQGAA